MGGWGGPRFGGGGPRGGRAASALVYALAGRLRETGRLERFQSVPGYAELAGSGDCAREFALVRCGLAVLARQYPDRVEMGS